MTLDKKLLDQISDVTVTTPDPERSARYITRFCEENPQYIPSLSDLPFMAKLFAMSQFLANHCIAVPAEFYSALQALDQRIDRSMIAKSALNELPVPKKMKGIQLDPMDIMRALRIFKKRYLLRITLRDITGKTDIQSSMAELSCLAETIMDIALAWSLELNQQKFGKPAKSNIALISLGKLGGEELNYSSDVDLIAVYDNDDGQTSGIPNPSGITYSKISNHEFYCKAVELFNKILSAQTDDGIVYRVDLRLRPQGQKGDITIPLKAYRTYYESWGRTWERMVLIRARPVAGDKKLGQAFMKSIEPFVWKKTMDISEIDEIRAMKKKIDSTFTRDDIKRGYGGIREAEFFIQTFQMLYGGGDRALKTFRISDALQALKHMNIVPEKELNVLWENYLYLRRIEHYLQMKEDLQTHSLPSSENELTVLAAKAGFQSRDGFLEDLKIRRMQIKNMYNSLLGTQEDAHVEALNLLEGTLTDKEFGGYLSFRNVKEPDKCLLDLKSIRENMAEFRTMQERKITREIMPQLLEKALTSENPDRAMSGLEKLLSTYGLKSAHLSALKEQKELISGIIKIFSLSPYLTTVFLSNQQYLNILIEEWSILKSLKAVEERLRRAVQRSKDLGTTLAEFRRFEEVRLGILFLLDILKIEDLFRGMSHLAEAIIRVLLDNVKSKGLAVMALGKLGGREMTFGSDLDIVFVSQSEEAARAAEKVMKMLTSYTDAGQIYSVDTRLRPDGAKGVLVKDIEGYRNYYLNSAQKWEIQALLKARPVAGNDRLARAFLTMSKEVILQRGHTVTKDDIHNMRMRIIRELSQESEGMDIKLGPGGIEEIEFYLQYLQLAHAQDNPDILVQNTLAAMDRLSKKSILSEADKEKLNSAFDYLRRLQTFLRLNADGVIRAGSDVTVMAAQFMDHRNEEEFLHRLGIVRETVLAIAN